MSMYSMDDVARFAEGDMTGEELNRFEEALKTDGKLQSDLVFYQNVHSSLKMKFHEDEDDQRFKATLHTLSNQHFKKEARVVPLQRYLLWSSAAAAIFILFFIWAPWRKDLYEQYAATEMIVMTERGESNAEADLQKTVDAFNKKDFSEAEMALERVVKADPQNSMAQYYYAITLIETGEADKSRSILEVVYNGNSVYKYDAAFYTALSFLKEKNELAARVWLKKIPVDASVYDKSQELLNKLK